MPLYKLVGNRILTTFQNWVTGAHLAEWHSGYRAYAVDVLKKIDFNGNSDGFDFDTEILLQVLSAGGRIGEVPIPTYYGDEVSYVNGMKYAKDVVIDSLAWRLQQKGFGAGHLASVGTDYAIRDAATSSHQAIISRLAREGPSRILDVGCAAGWTSEILAGRHTVVGVDQFAHPGVTDRMSEFIKADLGKGLPSKVGTGYDVVVAADVLEHLATPEHLLAQFKDVLNPDGFMLVSVPNVGHWYPRLRSLIGTFEYDQRGILDSTHLRFYNRRSFRRLLRIGGYHLKVETPLGFPAEALGPGMADDPPFLVRLIQTLEKAGLKVYPTLFAYQFLCELVPPVQSEVVTVVEGADAGLAGSTQLNPDSFGAGSGLPADNGATASIALDADEPDDHQRNNGDGGPEVKVRRPKAKDNV